MPRKAPTQDQNISLGLTVPGLLLVPLILSRYFFMAISFFRGSFVTITYNYVISLIIYVYV
jgi:hypothetical protein